MFNQEITVYRLEDDTFSVRYIKGVYFEHNERINVVNKGVQGASTGTIVIPADDNIDIKKEDIVIEGHITEELGQNKRFAYLQQHYDTYKVVAIDDMRFGDLVHWEVGVK